MADIIGKDEWYTICSRLSINDSLSLSQADKRLYQHIKSFGNKRIEYMHCAMCVYKTYTYSVADVKGSRVVVGWHKNTYNTEFKWCIDLHADVPPEKYCGIVLCKSASEVTSPLRHFVYRIYSAIGVHDGKIFGALVCSIIVNTEGKFPTEKHYGIINDNCAGSFYKGLDEYMREHIPRVVSRNRHYFTSHDIVAELDNIREEDLPSYLKTNSIYAAIYSLSSAN